MDKIHIRDLELYCKHGVYPEETFLGQKFLFDVTLYTNTRPAGLGLQLHGVHVVRSRGNSQLAGEQKIAGVAVGNLDELTLLALSADVLLQNNFHNVFLLMTLRQTRRKTENAGL